MPDSFVLEKILQNLMWYRYWAVGIHTVFVWFWKTMTFVVVYLIIAFIATECETLKVASCLQGLAMCWRINSVFHDYKLMVLNILHTLGKKKSKRFFVYRKCVLPDALQELGSKPVSLAPIFWTILQMTLAKEMFASACFLAFV